MKVLVAFAAIVLGLVVGVCSVALHERWWGLVFGIVATAATAYALPPGWWARMPFAFGWAAMVGYLAVPRDEGDYAVASDLPGYVLLGFAVALVVAAAVTLQPLRRGNPADQPS